MIPKSSTGFSLVELLVVVALIGILSSIGIVTYTGYIEGANKNSAENIVQQIALAQTEAYANSGSYYVTGCPATSTTSAAIESELFSGDNIIPDDNEFEMLYGALKGQETIKFWSTSFIRGTTLDNSIILVDEMQNLNFHELDSIITRVGENSKIIFCGDASQTDLTKTNERNGILEFMKIISAMDQDFASIEFGIEDIVRSGLVRNYLLAKTTLGM